MKSILNSLAIGLAIWVVGAIAVSKIKEVRYEGAAHLTFPSIPGASCSAVIVDNNTALTAGHCSVESIPGTAFVQMMTSNVKLEQGSSLTLARVVYVDGTRDFAIILGDFKEFTKAKTNFGNALFKLTQEYTSCGYPFGQDEPMCVNLGHPRSNDALIFNFNQAIMPGMSGGPVFDNETGELVGLNTYLYPAVMGGGSGFTLLLGLDRWLNVLKGN